MARKAKYDWGRSRDGRYQKFETRLFYEFDVTHNSQDSVYIDVAQSLSLINRKLVRQGQVFKIKGMNAWSRDSDADAMHCSVAALPRTWVMFNAYKKARSLWNQMNLQAIDALGEGNLPKYYDFKVFFDVEHFDNHHNSSGGDLTTNLYPKDGDENAFSALGEWVYSKYETTATTPLEMNIHMLGTHANADGTATGASGRSLPNDQGSIGAILAYQQSRGAAFTDQDMAGLDQNIDVDSPFAQLFAGDPTHQEILTDLDVDNDGPPYGADYPGGIQHPEGTFIGHGWIDGGNASKVGRRFTIPTFEAPLGLVKLDLNINGAAEDTSSVYLTFDTEIIGAC